MSKSTENKPVIFPLTDISEMLVKKLGKHEGHFEISLEFQIGVGAVGPSQESVLPGAIIGVKGVGLREVESPNPLSVDAAVVNPLVEKKTRSKSTKSS
jgi:hypothetical protein